MNCGRSVPCGQKQEPRSLLNVQVFHVEARAQSQNRFRFFLTITYHANVPFLRRDMLPNPASMPQGLVAFRLPDDPLAQ